MNTSKTVAIIGLGTIGRTLVSHLTKSSRQLIVAGRDLTKVETLAKECGASVEVASIDEAIERADIIVPAIYFGEFTAFMAQYANALHGKIIVDVTNPIAPQADGSFIKTIDAEESAGLIHRAALPEGATLVKALGTLGAASLASKANTTPRCVLFYASDCETAGNEVANLISDLGFAAHRVGALEESIKLEVFGELHEFGALGKTVTTDELKSLRM